MLSEKQESVRHSSLRLLVGVYGSIPPGVNPTFVRFTKQTLFPNGTEPQHRQIAFLLIHGYISEERIPGMGVFLTITPKGVLLCEKTFAIPETSSIAEFYAEERKIRSNSLCEDSIC